MSSHKSSTPSLAIIFNNLNIGGIEKKIIDITNHYCHRQNTKVILFLKHPKGELLPLLDSRITIISPPFHSPGVISSLLFPFWLSIQFIRQNPSVVLSFGNYSSICTLIARILSFSNARHVISEDSSITTQIENDTFSSLRRFLVRNLYPLSHKIITLTQEGKAKMMRISPGTASIIQILPNWLPLDFSGISNSTNNKTIDILFLGRYEDQKNPLLFLKICHSLINLHPQLKVSMYGYGTLESRIKYFVKRYNLGDNISILPATTNTQAIYNSSKLMLLTSTHEGFPLTILEATASLCLPVCKKIKEIVPFFDRYPDLILFNNFSSAVSLVNYLISHPKKRHSLALHYQKISLNSQHTNFQKTITFIDSLL